ncbi:folate-binding protein YgfZ [Janthinobacterium sp. 17J80-10]|uniref:CAF17-like 4Fe-4S cluster assembly/insertion protein YgfZ n=1 Tax=Janthinobacterium sp. 17J80-10 TaxID=2497863 RepID=UPI0019D6D90C|nr:folate-binding protein YgfZ [Janthinobacterium sp. 17J80-10]
MHPWQQFLEEQGYRFEQDRAFDALVPAAGLSPDTASAGFITPLTDLGLMMFSGEEAAKFLHNQLTNDVEHLGAREARLAAYCTPKGRMLASLLLWRESDAIFLQLPREIQPTVQKRLQMFILRAKVKAHDVSDTRVVLGVGGAAAGAALAPWAKELPAAPYARVDAAGGALIRVADAFGAPRYQWITTPEQAQEAWPQLTQKLQPAGTASWRLADILAGVPQIVKATQESFVPQMVNFEVIGGVNFRKGCYPGQEIVARSQYLGKLKRRMALALADAGAGAAPAAGMEVFSVADPDQPCGMVVNAEQYGPGEFAMLVELKTAALDEGSVHLGSAAGPALRMQALPYALPDAA